MELWIDDSEPSYWVPDRVDHIDVAAVAVAVAGVAVEERKGTDD